MNEMLLYKGLTLLCAVISSFVLILLILRIASQSRLKDSVNQQWEKVQIKDKKAPIKGQTVFVCSVCDWVYDENKGDIDSGLKPGTRFEDIPATWRCPVCGIGKEEFKQVIRKQEAYLVHLQRSSDAIETDMPVIYKKALTGQSPTSSMRTPKQANLLNNIQILPAPIRYYPL